MNDSHGSNSPRLILSAKAQRTCEAPISALIAAAVGNPDLISFAAGLVDPVTLPVEECAAITKAIFSDRLRGQSALQYDTTLGLAPLRHELLAHFERLEGKRAAEFALTADQIIVSTGSQQMLYLIGDVLIDPGDIVITTNPSYFVFTGTLQSLGAQVMAVPMDVDGMDVEALSALLQRLQQQGQLQRVKFVYCTSYFDNPTGRTLSLARRQRLMDIVRQFSRSHRILILEDAAYRELRYDGEDLPSIKSFDPHNQFVILTQTFSKPFAPGIKLGYTFLPHDVLDPVLQQKGNHDFGSANICQQIALEALRNGSYAAHLDLLRHEYQRKRDRMLRALEAHMPPGVSWTRPGVGLYVWVTLPQGLDARRQAPLFSACLQRGILYIPGDYCFTPDDHGRVPLNHLRLSFGQVAEAQIDEGIRRLAQAISQAVALSPARTTSASSDEPEESLA